MNSRLSLKMKGPWRMRGAERVARLSAEIRRGILRARIRDRDFGVISNNCWGAHIYQRLGVEYATPFVGLFLDPGCYLTLLSRLRWYLTRPLRFRDTSRYEYLNERRAVNQTTYPIGCLEDEVEIHFMHYGSVQEAASKWARRVARLTPRDDRLFVKFDDNNDCTATQLDAFERLPFQHKVCFVASPMPRLRSAVWIRESRDGHLPFGSLLWRASPKHFDAAGWINGSDGRSRWWRLFRCA